MSAADAKALAPPMGRPSAYVSGRGVVLRGVDRARGVEPRGVVLIVTGMASSAPVQKLVSENVGTGGGKRGGDIVCVVNTPSYVYHWKGRLSPA